MAKKELKKLTAIQKRQLMYKVHGAELTAHMEARNQLKVTEESLKLTISAHANYVDDDGNKASSPGGFMKQINKRIKQAFAADRDHMTAGEVRLLNACLASVGQRIKDGEADRDTRPEIKIVVYRIIEAHGRLVEELRETEAA